MTSSTELIESLSAQTLSVAEYLTLINDLISPLEVHVEGEVTDFKQSRDWVFFALKDAEGGAILPCGLHASTYRKIGVLIEEGMTVKVTGHGRITPKSGRFGFWVTAIEPLGEGALKRAYELLLKKLGDEGLYVRKRPLPQFISHVGVISSRNGVVVHDLMKNLRPLGIRLDFLHSGVEGESAAPELVKAINYFSQTKDKPQALIIIRGGGSLESLQGFNNEAVCRAIFASPIPVIVGIGHEVDVPIATLVADASASTPTAVAHLINDTWDELLRIPELVQSIAYRLDQRLTGVATSVVYLARSIEQSFGSALKDMQWTVKNFEQLVALVDPSRVLKRGYSIVYAADGSIVRSTTSLKKGDTVTAQVADGSFAAEVASVEKKKYYV